MRSIIAGSRPSATRLTRVCCRPTTMRLPEQQAAGFGPDVLTLAGSSGAREATNPSRNGRSVTLLSRPRTRFTAESDAEFYRKKKSSVVVRHVSGDRIVSMVEIVSPGNKSSRHGFRAFVDKACELLEARVHLLIVDPVSTRAARPARGACGDLGGSEATNPSSLPLISL